MLSAISRWVFSLMPASLAPGGGDGRELNETYRFSLGAPYRGDLETDDIPRYPPFAKGFPVTPVDVMLEAQRTLVERIQRSLGLTDREFETQLLPVLRRYAAFVHLLPASEKQHHRGAGGLFRHGLEVAFWAAQASEASIFSMAGTPQERRRDEPRWRLAVCLAGLMHDIGKPLTDVTIINREGSLKWNPYAMPLTDWAATHGIERYYLRWNRNRYRRHEEFAHFAFGHVLPNEITTYLAEGGQDIIREMQSAIFSADPGQVVGKLVLQADRSSVAKDLEANNLKVDEFAYGVAVEPYVVDAIRRLVKSGKWACNEVGAELWVTQRGVFINWRTAAADVVELLDEYKIPGIPRDADSLADLLIERGTAVGKPVEGSSEHVTPYWEVEPELLQQGEISAKVRLLMLRLANASQVFFNTEPPEPVAAIIHGDNAPIGGDLPADDSEGDTADGSAPGLLAGTEAEGGRTETSLLESAEAVIAQAKDVSLADMLGSLGAKPQQTDDSGETDEEGEDSLEPSQEEEADETGEERNAQAGAVEDTSEDAEAQDKSSSPFGALAKISQGVGMDMPFGSFGPEEELALAPSSKPSVARGNQDKDVEEMTSPATSPTPATGNSALLEMLTPKVSAVSEQPSDEGSLFPTFDEQAISFYERDAAYSREAEEEFSADRLSVDAVSMSPPVTLTAKPVASEQRDAEIATPNRDEQALELALTPSTQGGSRATQGRSGGPSQEIDLSPAPASPAKRSKKPRSERLGSGNAEQLQEKPATPHQVAEPTTRRKKPRKKAGELDWARYGKAGKALKTIIEPVLKGEESLGDALYLAGTSVGILYPQALQRVGTTEEVIALLDEAGLIAHGDDASAHPAQELEGLELVILKGPLADQIRARLRRLAAEVENELAISDSVAVDEQALANDGHQADVNEAPAEEPSLSQPTAQPSDAPGPEAPLFPQYTLKAPAPRNLPVDDGGAEMTTAQAGTKRGIPAFLESSRSSLDEEDAWAHDADHGETALDADGDNQEHLGPPAALDPIEALERLMAMIRKRSGRWLVTVVEERDGYLVTGDKALDVIAGEYPELSRSKLRFPLMFQKIPQLKHANGELYLRIEDE